MATGSRCVALLPIHYAARDDRWKWNIVQSIRTRTLLRQSHPAKILDGDFHLRTATEMTGLFRDFPQVLTNTFELAERCTFELQMSAPQFPAFKPDDGSTPRAFLRKLVLEGLHRRYRDRADGIVAQVKSDRPESTPMPAPAVISSASAELIASAANLILSAKSIAHRSGRATALLVFLAAPAWAKVIAASLSLSD